MIIILRTRHINQSAQYLKFRSIFFEYNTQITQLHKFKKIHNNTFQNLHFTKFHRNKLYYAKSWFLNRIRLYILQLILSGLES